MHSLCSATTTARHPIDRIARGEQTLTHFGAIALEACLSPRPQLRARRLAPTTAVLCRVEEGGATAPGAPGPAPASARPRLSGRVAHRRAARRPEVPSPSAATLAPRMCRRVWAWPIGAGASTSPILRAARPRTRRRCDPDATSATNPAIVTGAHAPRCPAPTARRGDGRPEPRRGP